MYRLLRPGQAGIRLVDSTHVEPYWYRLSERLIFWLSCLDAALAVGLVIHAAFPSN